MAEAGSCTAVVLAWLQHGLLKPQGTDYRNSRNSCSCRLQVQVPGCQGQSRGEAYLILQLDYWAGVFNLLSIPQ
ncbi:hypothetical protein KC347_g186 [Hortaea werneckii]|nr:hypothetical protein KC347_g186 [Hortaea werneckii]